jgi:hypothetical protein
MHHVLVLCLLLLSPAAYAAGDVKDSCNNPEVNQHWLEALKQHSDDPLVVRMFNMRTGLCGMLKNGQIDSETARSMWEQALTNALLESARQEQSKRGLLRLFGTF